MPQQYQQPVSVLPDALPGKGYFVSQSARQAAEAEAEASESSIPARCEVAGFGKVWRQAASLWKSNLPNANSMVSTLDGWQRPNG